MSLAKHLIGRVLGERYRLTRWIGGGGFADVYEAEDIKFVRARVAVKILKPEFSKRVVTEARIAREFQHINVVSVSDMGADGDCPYIVMEYLEGRTLEHLQPLLPRLIRKFVYEICGALQRAHEKGLVHRDLKLQNIMLVDLGSAQERFVILDFGIAAHLNAESTLRNKTMDGGGSIDYMPPEQLYAQGDQQPTPQLDIYSFGVILYELLTGRKPFQADGITIMAMLKLIEKHSPPRFAEVAPDKQIDSAIESLVLQCLSKLPERRPASIKEVAERFLAAWDESQDPDASHRPFVAPQPRQQTPPSGSPKPNAPQAITPSQSATPEQSAFAPAHSPTEPSQFQTMLPQRQTSGPAVSSEPEWTKSRGAYRVAPNMNDLGSPPLATPADILTGTLLPAESDDLQSDEPSQHSTSWKNPGKSVVSRNQVELPDEQAETNQHGFRWWRNALLLSTFLLLVLVISSLIIVQRNSVLSKVRRLAREHKYSEDVSYLDSGNWLTFPLVDRDEFREYVHQDWVNDAEMKLEHKEFASAIADCEQIQQRFPNDIQAAKILEKIAEREKQRIQEFADRADYQKAVQQLDDPRSPGTLLGKSRRDLWDREAIKSSIRKRGIAKTNGLMKANNDAAALVSAEKLLQAFPDNAELRGLKHDAELNLVVASGDQKAANGAYPEAVTLYRKAIELGPNPGRRQEVTLKVAQASYQQASDKLKSTPADGDNNADADVVRNLLKQVFSDLTIIQLKAMEFQIPVSPKVGLLRGKTFLLRAKLNQTRKAMADAICDVKFALENDAGVKTEAKEILTSICSDAGDEGVAHHKKASELASELDKLRRAATDAKETQPAIQLAIEVDKEWQTAVTNLDLAIAACEAALLSDDKPVNPQIPPLYAFRADARIRMSKPDYAGAVTDLKHFRRLVETIRSAPMDLDLKYINASVSLALIQATSSDSSLRSPAEAFQAANDANSRFEASGSTDLHLEAHILEAQAAAAAATGDFEAAVGFTEKALAILEAGSAAWTEHQSRLQKCYSKDKPFVASPKETSPTSKFPACVQQ
jgi:serine/threonine protein kinase